jgi:chemotaxis protein CheD
MSNLVDVQSGEVKCCGGDAQIISLALGSCIAVIGYNCHLRVGGIAHVMLPGSSPADPHSGNRLRYAVDAIDELFLLFASFLIKKEDVRLCITGAGNVLKRPDDTICNQNIDSVTTILSALNRPVEKSCLGGVKRRRVRLDVKNGLLYYAEGDDEECLFFDFLCT